MTKCRIILKHEFVNGDGSFCNIQFVSFLGVDKRMRKRLLKRGYCPALPIKLNIILTFRGLPVRFTPLLLDLK